MNDDNIDRLLREAGTAWAERVPIPRDLDESLFVDRRPHIVSVGRGTILTTVASVAVVFTAAAVVIALRASAPPPGGVASASASPGSSLLVPASSSPRSSVEAGGETVDGTPTMRPSLAPVASETASPELVQVGDRVEAMGNLIFSHDNKPVLCPRLDQYGPFLDCPYNTGVPVDGIDIRELPGSEDGHAWMTTWVTVRGIWTGRAIDVETATPSDRKASNESPPIVPCAEPEGGWPGNENTRAAEDAFRALDAELALHPEQYVGSWRAMLEGARDPSLDAALLVGTVGNPDLAYAHLRSIYPYNLCVVNVRYSASDLRAVLLAIETEGDRWYGVVDPAIDKVRVTTAVADADALALLGRYPDKVELSPVVRALRE